MNWFRCGPALKTGIVLANVPSERDIFADLLALNTEFDEVQIDIPNTTIAVETDRIVLREIDLGPFRIVARLEQSEPPSALRSNRAGPQPGRQQL